MIQDQVIPIDFGQGLDTKTDSKAVVPGKFIRLENGVFTNFKRISKRNGYTALGTTTAPKMVHGYNGELIAADSGNLYSWSPELSTWISKDKYVSIGVDRQIISEDSGSSGIADVAIYGDYALYGWATRPLNQSNYGSVVDLNTGNILVTQNFGAAYSTTISRIKCVLLGGTTLAIIYQKSSGEYGARTVTISGSSASFSAETVITTNAAGPFDVIETSTGGAFVYTNTSADVVTATLSTALAVSSATIATTVGDNCVVHISRTSNGNIWVYWTESTTALGQLTALTIYYAVYSSALAVVLARTSVGAQAAPYYVSNLISKSDSATQQTLYYGLFGGNGVSGDYLEYSNYITITSAGVVGSATLFANGVAPFSHPFTVGSNNYAVFYHRTNDLTVSTTATLPAPVQPTYFVLDLAAPGSTACPYVVARFASGVASSFNGYGINIATCPNVASFSSTKFYFACGLSTQALPNPSNFADALLSVYSYSFDFDNANAYRAVNCGELAVLNGGIVQAYDGDQVTELNFNLYPEITQTTQGAAGAIADGTYSYLAVFMWVDNQGNLHQSAPSPPKSITVAAGGGTATVTVSVTSAYLTRKPSKVIVALYRTTNGGTVYYLITTITSNIGGADPTVGFRAVTVDGYADASITGSLQAYTYPASSVLENSAPPPSMAMIAHNNRLWMLDAEEPNTVWYTKSFEQGVGLSPSAFLTEQIDPKFGEIVALGEMDEKIVFFKENGIFVQSGDGANDIGSGSTLSFPQIVPSDVGCNTMKSVISMPTGIMFKSQNGIYLLDRKLNVTYLGAEVEAYNSQTITGASLVPGKSQIRFLCSSGYTLVYDYIFNQWSTFTNHTGNSCTAWNNLFIYSTGTSVLQEASGTYTDNGSAFALLAQTSWLALASIQGFQRVRRLIMLGDFVNGNSASHALSISAAYDFSTTFQTAVSYQFGAASASGVFQYRERLPIQKCDSLSLLIQETTTGSSAEYIDLTNISFEAGVKKGLNKLGGTKSVG